MKTETSKKSHYPSGVEYSDLDRLESKKRYSKEYIEKRLKEGKKLNSKEKKLLASDLELVKYYNELEEQIKKLKNKMI